MGIFSSISTALPFLLQSVPAIKTGLQGRDLKGQKQALTAMGPLAKQQTELAKAQYDPNSALYQGIYNQEREQGNQNLSDTISELSRQNRKLQTLGRTPLLDAERGGESIFRNLVKGREDVGSTATRNTLARLQGAQNALQGAQNSYSGIYNSNDVLSKAAYQNDLTKVGGYYSIGDVLKNLFNLRQPETINWNQ